MKQIIIVSLLSFALVSCEKAEEPPREDLGGMYGVYENFGTGIRIVDSRGTDLLDPKTGKYTYDDIDVMVWKGKKTVPYRSYELESPVFSDYPKGYSIHNRVGTLPYYILGTSFPIGNKEDVSSKDALFYSFGLRIGRNGMTYQLRGEAKVFRSENEPSGLYGGGSAILTKRIWLDGKMVWEAEKEEKLPEGDRRYPEITIVVPNRE